MIRDEHWDKVFSDIEKNIDLFGRYYSLLRTKMESRELVDMSIAFMINDELYHFSKRLVETEDAEE